jgi:hypothetical protein
MKHVPKLWNEPLNLGTELRDLKQKIVESRTISID